jgi:hypothetical protein
MSRHYLLSSSSIPGLAVLSCPVRSIADPMLEGEVLFREGR